MSKLRNISAAVLAVAIASAMTNASARTAKPDVLTLTSSTPVEVAAIVAKWQDDLESGRLKLPTKARGTYEKDLESLSNQLAELESFDGLTEKQKVDLANRYESLRARTEGDDAKRNARKCSFQNRAGSHLRTTICLTAEEQAKIDEANQTSLRQAEKYDRRNHVNASGN